MQTITVQSISVKRGTSDKGDWVNTQITPTEGRKWTGFSEGLTSLKEGDVINITEYEEGTGRNFNKILKYEKVSSAPSASGANGKPEMTNEMWDEKARIERKSIESQTAAERITELWIAGKIPDDDPLITKLRAWLNKLGTQEPAKKAGEKAAAPQKSEEPKESIVNLDWLKEQMAILQSKELPEWEESALLALVKKTYQVEGDTVLEAVAKLEEGKAAHFVKKIEEAIDWNNLKSG